jgi:hypothetical protein
MLSKLMSAVVRLANSHITAAHLTSKQDGNVSATVVTQMVTLLAGCVMHVLHTTAANQQLIVEVK